MQTHNACFTSWLAGEVINEHLSNPNIEAGDFSYYSGYYHAGHFDEACVRYLLGDASTRNYKELLGEDFTFDRLRIGRFCSIASGAVFLMAGNQGHDLNRISVFPFDRAVFPRAQDGFQPRGDTVVGNDVWIGTEAMILPGVHIGDGAVIGARALVTHDVPAYCIVGGSPARLIRERFSAQQRSRLEQMAWWNWSVAQINEAMDWMTRGDVDGLYAYYLNTVCPGRNDPQ